MFVKELFVILYFIFEIKSFVVKVKTKKGLILGNRESTVFDNKTYYAFYRVPYARPPIGRMRFKDPKPVKEWKQPLDASTEYHGACAQAHIVHKHRQYGFENCLYLNIYTPNIFNLENQNLKAVIVWIHGYAFSNSLSHIYGGDFLIDNDIVVITLTHRVGAFGFLKINETDTNENMGLKDIIMGLKWIKKNIHYFGGDKNKVTAMGSGSASTFISLLLLTKHRGLFSKLILHSGSMFSPSMFHNNHLFEKYRLENEIKKRCNKNVSRASTMDIINATQNIYRSKDVINFQRPIVPFSPTLRGDSIKSLLKGNIYKAMTDLNFNNTPILIGFTSQEGISEAIPFIHNANYLKSFQTFFKFMVPFEDGCQYNYSSKTYKQISEVIKNRYFKDNISENSIQDFLKYLSDLYVYPIYKFIKSVVSKKSKIYVYKFNYVGNFNVAKATSFGNSNIQIHGAAQGDDICYILKCDPLWQSYVQIKGDKYNSDRTFIKTISQMWANFAKSEELTPIISYGNVTWLPMSFTKDYIFLFGKQNKLINSKSLQNMFKFWSELYKKYYDPKHCLYNKDEL